mmetsp:Transcript_53423/g.124361  ORF Transcript_53423/g.124361 Transcript_53423/m.124361 type:complete len:223 (-) Transcript_53423:604-1272(-)
MLHQGNNVAVATIPRQTCNHVLYADGHEANEHVVGTQAEVTFAPYGSWNCRLEPGPEVRVVLDLSETWNVRCVLFSCDGGPRHPLQERFLNTPREPVMLPRWSSELIHPDAERYEQGVDDDVPQLYLGTMLAGLHVPQLQEEIDATHFPEVLAVVVTVHLRLLNAFCIVCRPRLFGLAASLSLGHDSLELLLAGFGSLQLLLLQAELCKLTLLEALLDKDLV